jgi:acetylserotonin N-methyltransferase
MTGPQPIIELIYAFRRSKTMFAAVGLGIFDKLERGPAAVDDFPGFDRSAIERLLDGCVSLGLTEKDGALYRNAPIASQYLVRTSPDTMAGYILYSNEALFPMWARLEDAIREGTNRWMPVFGFPQGELFQHFFNSEAALRNFLMGMHGLGQVSSHAVASSFDLSRFQRMVDLGGGTGHLALAMIDCYPGMTAALFDLPNAIEFARELTAGSIDLIGGDFFKDPLPPADLYALGRILHDWTEEKIHRLLARIHAALPAGGGLLIAEALLDDDKRGPVEAQMQALNMLICTEGRERTLPEYRALLESAGFTNVEGRRTGTPLDAVLAIKP